MQQSTKKAMVEKIVNKAWMVYNFPKQFLLVTNENCYTRRIKYEHLYLWCIE